MRIALIGASSFLATHLRSALLAQGDQVDGWGGASAFSYRYPQQSLGNPELVAQLAAYPVIIHCAGAGIQPGHGQADSLLYEVNAFEPIRLVQQLQAQGYRGRLITFGSYFELGEEAESKSYTEQEFVYRAARLPNAYCKSKRLLTQYFSDAADLPFSYQHFVLTNIYGAGEHPNRLLPYLVRSIWEGKTLQLTSGVQRRQYTHVRDIAQGVAQALRQSLASGIYHLTAPEVISVRTLVEHTLSMGETLWQKRPEAVFGETQRRDLSMFHLAVDPAKAQEAWGFCTPTSLETGISEYFTAFAHENCTAIS